MYIKVSTDDLLSVAQAAKLLRKPRMAIYRWVDAKKIVGIKLGGILFIPKTEIKRLEKEEATRS